uniref:Shisa N-terminal domain-containing protein n=1 Tax=Esox lucius TaxID=8010 RepID=A0A3P8ZAI5_ESOLU
MKLSEVSMSAYCTSYYNAEKVFVNGFSCPKLDSDAQALFCCGFNDMKYCCDDPNSFFPYEYGYMWWLSLGALVGLSIAAVVLLAFIITICVLCYLFIATKPRGLDNGLPLQAPRMCNLELGFSLTKICLGGISAGKAENNAPTNLNKNVGHQERMNDLTKAFVEVPLSMAFYIS